MTSSISRRKISFSKMYHLVYCQIGNLILKKIWNNNYGLKMSHFRDMGRQTFKYDVINFQGKQFFVKNVPSCILLDRKFNFEHFQNKNQGLKIFYFRDMERKISHICVTFFSGKGFCIFFTNKHLNISGHQTCRGNSILVRVQSLYLYIFASFYIHLFSQLHLQYNYRANQITKNNLLLLLVFFLLFTLQLY